MAATVVSLTLAVATAWGTIFLGFLPTSLLRLGTFSREILLAAIAWIVVGLTAPAAICHWYFIFALICFVVWRKLRNERALSAKTWLSVASGLGISIGVIFLIQAAPALYPPTLLPREKIFLVTSIYLGGAVTGLAYATHVLARDPDAARKFASGYSKILILLVILWDLVFVLENRVIAVSCISVLALMAILPVLSFFAFHALRIGAQKRARWICAMTSLLAFGTSMAARWLLL